MDRGWRHGEISPNCPRCGSSNTKFCYYNNYSLSQPRYFCKGCRRYWTKGGSLRNVPVGGGCRKNRRGKAVLRINPISSEGGKPPRSTAPNLDSAPFSSYLLATEQQHGSSSGGPGGSHIDIAAVYAKFLNQNPGNGDNDNNGVAAVVARPGISHEIAELRNDQLDPPSSMAFPGLQLPDEDSLVGCIPVSTGISGLSNNDRMFYLGLESSSSIITKQNCHEDGKLHGFGGGLPPLPGEEILWSDSHHPGSMLSNNPATQEPVLGQDSNHLLFGNWSPFDLSSSNHPDTFSGST